MTPLSAADHPRPANSLRSAALITLLALLPALPARGQFGGFGFGQAVGGISIDAAGIVRNLEPGAAEPLSAQRRAALANGGIRAARGDGLRKVSLARVATAVDAAVKDGKPLAPEILFLGGLERITHVFVDPERHDIVLAGPADAAVVDAAGNVVATGSRRPLLQLEDLIVALRAIDGARDGGMRCSIDPAPEGVARLRQFLAGQRTIGEPEGTLQRMEELLGPQRVTVGGVPADSRFARVLVAADYRLKRLGMGLDESGIPGLSSYVAMLPPNAPAAATLPRFWLEASYDPIARDPDELAWQITGRKITCLTETDLFGADGPQRGAGAADPVARRWCAAFSERYDDLAAKQPVFAELVNCVDLAVVAALIHGRQLDQRAGLDLGRLLDPEAVRLPTYEAPATVPTVARGQKRGMNWVVTASGGVSFQPWQFASAEHAIDAALVATRTGALAERGANGPCWWD